MHITIITPENVVYNGEASALTVPGINGDFQMLENHAAIISVLVKGNLKIKGASKVSENFKNRFAKEGDSLIFPIEGGTLEFKNNRAVVLAD